MAKAPELLDVANILTAVTALNTNNSRIEEAFANTISRDGSTPNSMSADLDMNSNDLLNVGELNTQDLTIRGEPITALLDGAVEESEASALAALEAKNKAQEWAENPVDDPVETGQYSALHHAAKASQQRDAAALSAAAAALFDGPKIKGDIEADTSLTMTPGLPGSVGVGDRVATDHGQMVVTDAADPDRVTAGGVKLLAIPLYGPASPEYNVEQLGVVCDDVTDAGHILRAALARGYRKFLIPGPIYCAEGLVFSQKVGGVVTRYNAVTLRGVDNTRSSIRFGNGVASYPDMSSVAAFTAALASVPVGLASYHTVDGVEGVGSHGLTMSDLTVYGPKKGITLWWTSSSHHRFDRVIWRTNSASTADRVFSHRVFKDCVDVLTSRNQMHDAYFIADWLIHLVVPGRTTAAPNAVYNDHFEWDYCEYVGTSWARIVDAGSLSQGIRVITGLYSTNRCYFGYLGGRGITFDFNGWWSEACMMQVRFQWQLAADAQIPVPASIVDFYEDGSARMTEVCPASAVLYGMLFTGGWAFGGSIRSCQVFGFHGAYDLTNVAGHSVVDSISRVDGVAGSYILRAGAESTVLGKIDYHSSYAIANETPIEHDALDYKGAVHLTRKSPRATSIGGVTYNTVALLETAPRGGPGAIAGTGGTTGIAWKASMTVPWKGEFVPVLAVDMPLFTGVLSVALTVGGASSGAATGRFEWLVHVTRQAGAAGLKIIGITPVSGVANQGSYYKIATPPQLLFASIAETLDGTPKIYLGFTGGINGAAAEISVQADGAAAAGVGAASYNLVPTLSFMGQVEAEAILAAAETATPGCTTGATMVVGPANYATVVWDPAEIAAGGTLTKIDIALPGAALLDQIEAVPPSSMQGLLHSAYVVSAGVVGIVLFNPTAGAINLASGTWRVINRGQA